MTSLLRSWQLYPVRILGGLTISLALAAITELVAAQAPELPKVEAPPAQPALTLSQCIQIALEKQPALAAYRASLAAAEVSQHALDNVKVPEFIEHDLCYRRKQAALGVVIAHAKVMQEEQDTIYAVTRTYLSTLYARQVLNVLNDASNSLRESYKEADNLLQTGARRDLNKHIVATIQVYISAVQGRQEEALAGIGRARAGLREAMGVGPEFCLELEKGELPFAQVEICKEQIQELALARRGEIIQASNAAEVFALEVKAQDALCLKFKVPTFASATDLHADQIPQGINDGEYRPGAVGLQMPPVLVGARCDRVERARHLDDRAESVVEKTRNLILLETEEAFLRWQEGFRKTLHYRKAADDGEAIADNYKSDYLKNGVGTYKDALDARILATQVRIQAIEAAYRYDLALAALQRITAGGFCAGFTKP